MSKQPFVLRWVLAFVLVFLFIGEASYSQTDKRLQSQNVYTTWVKLAMLGKNQAEIESYFLRKLEPGELEKVKTRIRNTVLDNLKRSGLESKIAAAYDMDDLNVVIHRVLIEIRYVGMEHDDDLRQTIKEEFGLTLERL